MDSNVEFVACDNPHATRLTLHILAAVAEHEREMISVRTKAALAAAKARGEALGRHGAEVLAPAYKVAAQARAEELRPILTEIAGRSTRAIAAELTARGIPTPRGGRWQAQSVANPPCALPQLSEHRKTLAQSPDALHGGGLTELVGREEELELLLRRGPGSAARPRRP